MTISSGRPRRPIAAPSSSRGVLPKSITIAALAVGLASGATAAARQFSSGVAAVEVYAAVTDDKGEPVRHLTAADFEILEDGKPQTVSTFVAGDFPLTVAVGLDRSFSVAGERLAAMKRAAVAFLDALRPEDEVMLLEIGSTVDIVKDRAAVRSQIEKTDAFGTTALHDAILAALDAVDASRGRRALVLMSDGNDRYSRANAADVLTRARAANVIVYPIAFGRDRPELFAELAALTGGRSFNTRDSRELLRILQAIARELRFQYLLGYAPSRPLVAGANEWRSIEIKLKKPGLRVQGRDGYLVK
jgi:Ca-activated chloride channel family protein